MKTAVAKHAFLNASQVIAIQAYANGDFAHLLEIADQKEFDESLKLCGDTLLVFIVIELGVSEDCDNLVEAERRMVRAVDQLQEIADALQDAEIDAD